jgi:predicted GIY-YIG superfamily endonuclease
LCIRLEGYTFSLPYIKGVSEKLARILKKGDIGVVFSAPNTIKGMVDFAKDLINSNMHKGVYFIPCSYSKVYIGETNGSMNIRLKEHSANIKWNGTKKYALAKHSSRTSHLICLEDAKNISKVDHYGKRKIMEALEIEFHPNNLNGDEGWKLIENWKPLIFLLKNSQASNAALT